MPSTKLPLSALRLRPFPPGLARFVRILALALPLAVPTVVASIATAPRVRAETPSPAPPGPARPASAGAAAVDVVFALDNSGSMRAHDPNFLARAAVLAFAEDLATRAAASHFEARIAVVLFDDDVELALAPTRLVREHAADLLAPALARLDYSGSRTRSADAIERALYALRSPAPDENRRAIVLLTDGLVDTGDSARDRQAETWLREDLAGESRERGIPIFGLAFTDRADYQLLQAVARKTGADYYRAERADELAAIGAKILARILSERPSTGVRSADTTDSPGPSLPPVAAAPAPDASGDGAGTRLGWLPWAILFVAAGYLGLRARRRAAAGEGDAPSEGTSVPVAQLLDVGGVLGETGRAIPLRPGRTRIGRDPQNDLVIQDDTISSEHAVIELDDGRYWLEDLRSTNGTRHGDARLGRGERVALKGGDHVRFADVDLMFVVAGYAPGGATVLLPSTSTPPAHWRTARPAAKPPVGAARATDRSGAAAATPIATPAFETPPGELFRDCLDYHLERVAELSSVFAKLVARAFDEEMRAAIRMAANELVKTAQRGDDVATRAYTRDRIRYVLCGAPGGMDVAARAYQTSHGGFTRFLTEQLEDERFRADRCEVLAVLTFGRAAGEPWVTLTLTPAEGQDPRIDLLSFELLSESERRALGSLPAEVSQSGRS